MNTDDLKSLLDEVNTDLTKKKVSRVSNSIGSHIFIRAGNDILNPETGSLRKEWTIWVGNSSWRITKNGSFLAGSGDEKQLIQLALDQLMHLRIIRLSFVTEYPDLMVEFEEGYILNTFVCWNVEDQWTIFTPTGKTLALDSVKPDPCTFAKEIPNEFIKVPSYKQIVPFISHSKILNAYFNEWSELEIVLTNSRIICFENAVWRLEKDNRYLIGFLDLLYDVDFDPFFQELIGKEINTVQVQDNLMDSVFVISDVYTLKTFSRSTEECSWYICDTKNLLFEFKTNHDSS